MLRASSSPADDSTKDRQRTDGRAEDDDDNGTDSGRKHESTEDEDEDDETDNGWTDRGRPIYFILVHTTYFHSSVILMYLLVP